GRLLVPARRLGLILRHAPAFVVAKSEVALATRVALLGSQPQPGHSLLWIALDAAALEEGRPHVALRARHARLRERRPEVEGGAMVAGVPGCERLLQALFDTFPEPSHGLDQPAGCSMTPSTKGLGARAYPSSPTIRSRPSEARSSAIGSIGLAFSR